MHDAQANSQARQPQSGECAARGRTSDPDRGLSLHASRSHDAGNHQDADKAGIAGRCEAQNSKPQQKQDLKPHTLKREYVIYAPRSSKGTVFYIGRTCVPEKRMDVHRARFGKRISMQILEEHLTCETSRAAEKLWIAHFWKETSGRIRNVAHTKRMYGPKRTRPAGRWSGKDRITLSVRNVSIEPWDAVQAKSKLEGVAVWKLLDEGLDYVLGRK